MRRRLVLLAAAVLAASSCGSGSTAAPTVESADALDDTPLIDSTTTTSPASSTTSTLPTTSTTPAAEDVDDPLEAALEALNDQWTVLEPWGDGFVRLESVVDGAPVVDRDSDVGALFPDEVFDAIEAAGATDVAAAFDAVSGAGLLSVVLEVLQEHPEAWAEIVTGSGTFSMRANTTTDGETWTETMIPFLAAGRLAGSGSDGEHLALAFEGDDSATVRLATTIDLAAWSITELTATHGHGGRVIDVHRVADGWYVLPSQDESSADGWLVDDVGSVEVAGRPFEAGYAVEPTDAGLVAWGPESDGAGSLRFSTDGVVWEARDAPFAGPISGLAAVDGGLVLSRSVFGEGPEVYVGSADGRDWESAELPAEVDFPVWIRDEHHRGVVQRVAAPGLGRGGAIRPVVPHTTVVDYEGRSFRFEFDGFDLVTAVVDLATGASIGVGTSELDDSFGYSRVGYTDDTLIIYDDTGNALGEVPRADFLAADREAVDAALAALSPAEAALFEDRYVLASFDGRAWRVMVTPVDAEGETRRVDVVSVNGMRVLFGDGHRYWVEEGTN